MKNKIENLKKNEIMQLISWWSISFVINFIILHHLHFSLVRAIFEAAVTNSLLFLFSLVLRHILNFHQTKDVIRISNIGLVASLSLLHLVISLKLNALVFNLNFKNLIGFNPDNIYRFLLIYLLLFLTFFQLWMNKFKLEQEKATKKILEIERQLNQAELNNIQQQLQPHFLFNSLNSISALTIIRPEEARRMVQLLADFLRGTLSREKEKMMPLSEEINYLNLYLEIEKVRFGHRLNVEFNLDEQCKKSILPALILQPIVENAIKYGLYGSTDDVTISVKSVCKSHSLEISISNPYTKENEKNSKGLGFGLSSIQRKLYLLYGQNDLMKIDKSETNFTTTLIIPQL